MAGVSGSYWVSEDECTLPIDLPPELLAEYSLQPQQFEADEIIAYMNGQASDETVLHVEFIKKERVLGKSYSIWDVVTDKNRWWVITNLTNLYLQSVFKSMDYTLSFHIGLMARLSERQDLPRDEKTLQFLEIERRQAAIHESFGDASEAIEFQQIGLQLREQLLRLVAALNTCIIPIAGGDAPKKGDFNASIEVIANTIYVGKRKAALRKFVKSSSNDAWQLVGWLTHAQSSDQMSALIAMQAVEALVGHLLFSLTGYEDGAVAECPDCKSRRVHHYFDGNLGDEGGYFQSCQACAWNNKDKSFD